MGGFFVAQKKCQKGKKVLARFVQIGKIHLTPHKHGGDEVEQDENWRETQISHVQAGIVAMENLLDDGDRDDAVYVLWQIASIFDQLSASDELPDEVTDELYKAQEIVENAYLMTGRES